MAGHLDQGLRRDFVVNKRRKESIALDDSLKGKVALVEPTTQLHRDQYSLAQKQALNLKNTHDRKRERLTGNRVVICKIEAHLARVERSTITELIAEEFALQKTDVDVREDTGQEHA